MGNIDLPVAFCRNDGVRSPVVQILAQVIGVKCPVRHQGIEPKPLDQLRHTGDFTALAGKPFEPDKVAERVGEGKDPLIKSEDRPWSSVRLLSARWPD